MLSLFCCSQLHERNQEALQFVTHKLEWRPMLPKRVFLGRIDLQLLQKQPEPEDCQCVSIFTGLVPYIFWIFNIAVQSFYPLKCNSSPSSLTLQKISHLVYMMLKISVLSFYTWMTIQSLVLLAKILKTHNLVEILKIQVTFQCKTEVQEYINIIFKLHVSLMLSVN